MLTLLLALLDGAVGVYLVRYALTRERRDKDGVLAVGVLLVICAVALVVAELLFIDGPQVSPGSPSTRL